jgi:hypothetical protein
VNNPKEWHPLIKCANFDAITEHLWNQGHLFYSLIDPLVNLKFAWQNAYSNVEFTVRLEGTLDTLLRSRPILIGKCVEDKFASKKAFKGDRKDNPGTRALTIYYNISYLHRIVRTNAMAFHHHHCRLCGSSSQL